MRIGITCYPTYGGSGAMATELGLALGRRGHEVHMISYASPFRLRGYAQNVVFHEVDLSGAYPLMEYFPYSLALSVKQAEVAERENLEILHVHYAVPHATAAFVAKEMLKPRHDIKVVTTLHGTDITLVGQDKSFFTVTKFSIEKSDALTAVSEYLRDETYEAFGCRNCGIEVIPNFVNREIYRPADDGACRSSLAPKGEKVVMHISNFRPVKRVLDVVRVFAAIRKSVATVLVFVGDGPDRPAAERLAAELGIADAVKFLGKQDAVVDLLQGADLFLLPSASESFGLAALEAMACGVPVIGSEIGGLSEVVLDNETGYLCALGDVAAMAARAIEVLRDADLMRRLRAGALKRAEHFDEERVVPMYEALYHRVLGR